MKPDSPDSQKNKKRFNHFDPESRFSKPWNPNAKRVFIPDSPLMQEARQLRLKRRFSQNFLINATVLEKIASAMALQPGDPVLEIGAGSGFLTDALLKTGAKLTAVELDSTMCYYLKKKFHAAIENKSLRLHEGDFLKLAPTVMNDPELVSQDGNHSFKVVGNLPYGITSKILFKLLGEIEDVEHDWRPRISQLTIMVQKEVAERITAKPGDRAYNALSIAMQLRSEARLEFIVPSRDFYPAPKVDSAIVSLMPRTVPLIAPEKLRAFSTLVQAAFSAKRKTIKNALMLRKFASPEQIDTVFARVNIDPKSRAEALSIQEFGALTDAFGLYAGQA